MPIDLIAPQPAVQQGLFQLPGFLAGILTLVVWSISWKGVALWRSARNNQKWWFVALIIINTAGILEILYLVFFQKGNKK